MKPMMKNTELISQAELYPKSAFAQKRTLGLLSLHIVTSIFLALVARTHLLCASLIYCNKILKLRLRVS